MLRPLLLSLLIACGCTAPRDAALARPDTTASIARDSASPQRATAAPRADGSIDGDEWYRRARKLDLTGSNPRDSLVLTALGAHIDSLAIIMRFFVDGQEVYRHAWHSEYELYDVDSLRQTPDRLDAYLRSRFDDVVTTVRRAPIDAEAVQHMGDPAVLDSITPRPTHHVMLAYAFETTVFLAWDPMRRRLVNFMECC